MERGIILTAERPITTNSRAPNITRIILLRWNTAYALKPHTAIGRRVGEMKKQLSVRSIKPDHRGNRTHSQVMPIRPKILRIVQIRYPVSQLYMRSYDVRPTL